MHAAVLESNVQGIRSLLANGSHPELNALDDREMTPLLWAVYRGDEECVALLLEHGADPNKPGDTGETPLWHAEDDFGLTKIAALLRDAGAVK